MEATQSSASLYTLHGGIGNCGEDVRLSVDTEDGVMVSGRKNKRLRRQDSDGEESQSDFGDGREGGIAEKELQGGTVCTAYSLHW